MRFWIDRHGCAKNDVDGEEIVARLESAGHSFASRAADADLVIVNTCGFIEDAKKESIEAVVAIKAAYPEKRVLVAGCLAQRYASELAAELPEADGVVGNADLSAVLSAAEATLAGERPVVVPEASPSIGTVRRVRRFDFPGTAHVKVTEGCSNFCAFCAIPLIRGALRSRPLDEVVFECADLLAQDVRDGNRARDGNRVRELVLIGQDLGSYGRDLAGVSLLPELLERLTRLEGDFALRTLYIHPDNFPERILPIMASDRRLVPYLDLPFQHASARILGAMNRRGDAETYLGLLERIRAALPDAAIRSTFLVGFPGETDEDFAAPPRLPGGGAPRLARELRLLAGGGHRRLRPAWARAQEDSRGAPQGDRGGSGAHNARGPPALRGPRDGRARGGERPPHRRRGRAGRLSLGRAWNQASDVDGLTVLHASAEPGSLARARIVAVNGVDFEAVPLGNG